MMNSMKTNMSDVHFWIEEDNKIIDWDFSIYDSIKKINNCIGERQYEEFDKKLSLEYFLYFNKNHNDTLKRLGFSKQDFYTIYSEHFPMNMNCFKNCMYYKKHHPSAVIKIGKMGWRKRHGGIHWEFG